jgi:hypothetical protein
MGVGTPEYRRRHEGMLYVFNTAFRHVNCPPEVLDAWTLASGAPAGVPRDHGACGSGLHGFRIHQGGILSLVPKDLTPVYKETIGKGAGARRWQRPIYVDHLPLGALQPFLRARHRPHDSSSHAIAPVVDGRRAAALARVDRAPVAACRVLACGEPWRRDGNSRSSSTCSPARTS